MSAPYARRPFLHGVILGIVLPAVAVVVPFLLSDAREWLTPGSVYGLMPLFMAVGVVCFFLTRQLRPHYERMGLRPLHLTHGLLIGSWLAGTALVWWASTGIGPGRRLFLSLSGAMMLVAFWVWVGSVAAHAPKPSSASGPGTHTEPLSPPPK